MNDNSLSDEVDRAHREKMIRRDEVFEKKMATKTREQGLLIVNTGPGKGKTTAALGMAIRAMGHGMQVGIVQFIKGAISTGEGAFLESLGDRLELHIMGEGFTWKTQDRQRDIAAAEAGWRKAVELLRDPRFQMVILDELNVVLKYQYLPVEQVVAELSRRRGDLHVVVTGRNAPQPLIELADLVTEMTLLKHPFKQGIKPQKGVEF